MTAKTCKMFLIALLLLTAKQSQAQYYSWNDRRPFWEDIIYFIKHPPECIGIGTGMMLPRGDIGEYYKNAPSLSLYMCVKSYNKWKVFGGIVYSVMKPRVSNVLQYDVEQDPQTTIYPGYMVYHNAAILGFYIDWRYRFVQAHKWSIYAGPGLYANYYDVNFTEYLDEELPPTNFTSEVRTISLSACTTVEYRASEHLSFMFDWRYNASLFSEPLSGNYSHGTFGVSIAYIPRVEDSYYLNY